MEKREATTDDPTMEMARAALEQVKGGLLRGRLGRVWGQFAPMSVGAIGSAAMIVGAAELGRRILRRGSRRSPGWIGVLALPVLAILLAPTPTDEEAVSSEGEQGHPDGEPAAGADDDAGASVGNGRGGDDGG